MSWSISAKGTKVNVLANLNAARTAKLSHVQGKEKEIAEKAVDLALAVVQSNSENSEFDISIFGSASLENGEQVRQGVSLAVMSCRMAETTPA
jgi:hypothetical protein